MTCRYVSDTGSRCEDRTDHTHCVSCGSTNPGALSICAHHHTIYGDEWSESNRIWCAFLHRGVEPPRLEHSHAFDEPWA